MEQYLDQKDGKWHITLWTELPRVIVKNKLNFRIKSVTLNDGSIVSDPQINNSKYIFSIHESMLGKRVFFNFGFDTNEILNISRFNIGLCDEMVIWLSNTIITIENKYLNKNNNLDKSTVISVEKNNIDIISKSFKSDIVKEITEHPPKAIVSSNSKIKNKKFKNK